MNVLRSILPFQIATVIIVDIVMRLNQWTKCFINTLIRAVIANQDLGVRLILLQRTFQSFFAELWLVVCGNQYAD